MYKNNFQFSGWMCSYIYAPFFTKFQPGCSQSTYSCMWVFTVVLRHCGWSELFLTLFIIYRFRIPHSGIWFPVPESRFWFPLNPVSRFCVLGFPFSKRFFYNHPPPLTTPDIGYPFRSWMNPGFKGKYRDAASDKGSWVSSCELFERFKNATLKY